MKWGKVILISFLIIWIVLPHALLLVSEIFVLASEVKFDLRGQRS